MGFTATLKFRKFRVALDLMFRVFFLNFAKSSIFSFLPKFDGEKKILRAIFEI